MTSNWTIVVYILIHRHVHSAVCILLTWMSIYKPILPSFDPDFITPGASFLECVYHYPRVNMFNIL